MSEEIEFQVKFENRDRRAKLELLKIWRQRLLRASLAHYRAADIFKGRHRILTVFNMISAITVLFLANNQILKSEFGELDILLPMASLVTVLTAAIHYLVNYQERASQHKMAGNEFSIYKRSIERAIIQPQVSDEYIATLSLELDHVAKRFPHVSRSIWTKTIEIMEKSENISVNDRDFWDFVEDKGKSKF